MVVLIVIALVGIVALGVFAFARSATDSTTGRTPADPPYGDHRHGSDTPPDAAA